MKIGILGAGQIGGTLTRCLTALGHEVRVANSRGPQSLSELASETGATASVPEAVRGVDLVVVTIPEKNIPDLQTGLFAATPDRVVVVDTGNYYPRQRDGRIEAIEAGLPESKWVAQQLGTPVRIAQAKADWRMARFDSEFIPLPEPEPEAARNSHGERTSGSD